MATPSDKYIGWSDEKQITVDPTNIGSDLLQFPLYVEFTSDSDIGASARSDGHDIRFALLDGTNLPYERISFSVDGGVASGQFFVRVDLTATDGGLLYLVYGNSSASQDFSTPIRVWDSNYQGVWHMSESLPDHVAFDSTNKYLDAILCNGASWTTGLPLQQCISLDRSNNTFLKVFDPPGDIIRSGYFTFDGLIELTDVVGTSGHIFASGTDADVKVSGNQIITWDSNIGDSALVYSAPDVGLTSPVHYSCRIQADTSGPSWESSVLDNGDATYSSGVYAPPLPGGIDLNWTTATGVPYWYAVGGTIYPSRYASNPYNISWLWSEGIDDPSHGGYQWAYWPVDVSSPGPGWYACYTYWINGFMNYPEAPKYFGQPYNSIGWDRWNEHAPWTVWAYRWVQHPILFTWSWEWTAIPFDFGPHTAITASDLLNPAVQGSMTREVDFYLDDSSNPGSIVPGAVPYNPILVDGIWFRWLGDIYIQHVEAGEDFRLYMDGSGYYAVMMDKGYFQKVDEPVVDRMMAIDITPANYLIEDNIVESPPTWTDTDLLFGENITGKVSGFRMSSMGRSDDWLTFEQNNLQSVDNELTIIIEPPSQIIDDGQPGFSVSNGTHDFTTSTLTEGYLGDHMYCYAGSSTPASFSTADWTFTVTPGTYQISVTWYANSARCNNSPFNVYDGSNPIPVASATFDQTQDPNDYTYVATDWEILGAVVITSTELRVELTTEGAQLSKYVIADAVRIEEVIPMLSTPTRSLAAPQVKALAPTVIDNGDAGFTVWSAAWLTWPLGYNGDIHYTGVYNGGASTGVEWRFPVTNGKYTVAITWPNQSNRATNVPFRVYNGQGTSAVIYEEIDQTVAPSDFPSGQTWDWHNLGVLDITTNDLVVTMLNIAGPGGRLVIADAVRIEEVVGAVPNGPYVVRWGDTTTLDGSGSDMGVTTNYTWKVGATTIATGENPTLDVATVISTIGYGEHVLTLTVSNGSGNGDSENTVLYVENVAPVPVHTGPYLISDGNSVTLNGTGSYDLDGSVASYHWYTLAGDTIAFTSTYVFTWAELVALGWDDGNPHDIYLRVQDETDRWGYLAAPTTIRAGFDYKYTPGTTEPDPGTPPPYDDYDAFVVYGNSPAYYLFKKHYSYTPGTTEPPLPEPPDGYDALIKGGTSPVIANGHYIYVPGTTEPPLPEPPDGYDTIILNSEAYNVTLRFNYIPGTVERPTNPTSRPPNGWDPFVDALIMEGTSPVVVLSSYTYVPGTTEPPLPEPPDGYDALILSGTSPMVVSYTYVPGATEPAPGTLPPYDGYDALVLYGSAPVIRSYYVYVPGTTEPPLPEPPDGYDALVLGGSALVISSHYVYVPGTTEPPLSEPPDGYDALVLGGSAPPHVVLPEWVPPDCDISCVVSRNGDLNIVNSAVVIASIYSYIPDDCGGLWIVPDPGADVGISHLVYDPVYGCSLSIECQIDWLTMTVEQWEEFLIGEIERLYVDPCGCCGVQCGAIVTWGNFTHVPAAEDEGKANLVIVPDPGALAWITHYIYIPTAEDEGKANLVIVPDPGAPASYSAPVSWNLIVLYDGEGLVLVDPGAIAIHSGHDYIYFPEPKDKDDKQNLIIGGTAPVTSSVFNIIYVPGTTEPPLPEPPDGYDALILSGTSLLQVHYIYIPEPEDEDNKQNLIIGGTSPMTASAYGYVGGQCSPEDDALCHCCCVLCLDGDSTLATLNITYIPGVDPDDRLVLIDPGAVTGIIADFVYIPEPKSDDGYANLVIGGTALVTRSHYHYTPDTDEGLNLIDPGAIVTRNRYYYIPGTTVEVQAVLYDGCGNALYLDPAYQYDDDALHIQGTSSIVVVSSTWTYVSSGCGLFITPDATTYPYYFIHYVYWPELCPPPPPIYDCQLTLGGTSPVLVTGSAFYVLYDDEGVVLIDPGVVLVVHYIYIPSLFRDPPDDDKNILIIGGTALVVFRVHYEYFPGDTVEIQPIPEDECGPLPLDPAYQYDDDALHIQGTSPIVSSTWTYVPSDCPPLIINSTASPDWAQEYWPTGGLCIGVEWWCAGTALTEWAATPPPPEPPEPLIRKYTPIDVLLPTSQAPQREQYQYAVFQRNTEDPVVPLLFETEIEATMSKMNLEKRIPMPTRSIIGLSVRKVLTYRDEIVQVAGR